MVNAYAICYITPFLKSIPHFANTSAASSNMHLSGKHTASMRVASEAIYRLCLYIPVFASRNDFERSSCWLSAQHGSRNSHIIHIDLFQRPLCRCWTSVDASRVSTSASCVTATEPTWPTHDSSSTRRPSPWWRSRQRRPQTIICRTTRRHTPSSMVYIIFIRRINR